MNCNHEKISRQTGVCANCGEGGFLVGRANPVLVGRANPDLVSSADAIDPGEKSHGMVLTADTYVPANPETGARARIVATIAPESAYSQKSGFRNPAGPFFTTPAARDAFAVRVLDCWATKHYQRVPSPTPLMRGESVVWAIQSTLGNRTLFADSPAEARFAAAQALVAEDPSLGDL